jgi:hypothetical protein
LDEDLARRLSDARQTAVEAQGLRSRLAFVQSQTAGREAELARLAERLREEQDDVRRLEGLGLTAIFATMFGTKETRLARERAEVVSAVLRRDACAQALAALRADATAISARIHALGDVDGVLAGLLAEKERALRAGGEPVASRLDSIDAAAAAARATVKEIAEAVSASDAAIAALAAVAASLRSAGNWGTFDLVGGGMIATWAKHERIDEARAEAAAAQRALDRLSREIADVRGAASTHLVVEIAGFTKFADYFFDGLIADWCVQSKIDASRRNVEAADRSVRETRRRLAEQHTEIRRELDLLADERRRVVESA